MLDPLHLAIDTSALRPSVALLQGETPLAEWIGPGALKHHETLLAGIDECRKKTGFALDDLGCELAVGAFELRGPFLDPAFQPLLGLAHGLDQVPRLILPPAPAQSRLDHADQGGGMEGPLQKADIAERAREPLGRRVALQAASAQSQDDQRKVRPGGLVLHPGGKGGIVLLVQHLLYTSW